MSTKRPRQSARAEHRTAHSRIVHPPPDEPREQLLGEIMLRLPQFSVESLAEIRDALRPDVAPDLRVVDA